MGLNTRAARTLLALTAAAAVAGLTACGTPTATATPPPPSSAAAPNSTSMSMPPPPSSQQQSQPVAADAVTIKGFAFSPANITVKVGTTVTWTNQDQDAHTVTAKNGSFGSSALDTGASYKFTFTKPGTYDYLCTIHPFMTATVVVTP